MSRSQQLARILFALAIVRSPRSTIIAVAAALGLAHNALAQAPGATNPLGVWRGTSLCSVRPSSCNDEIVVYRITRAKTSDSLSLDAYKIVRGREEGMGALGCSAAAAGVQLTCAMPKGVWHFTIRSDSLVGELRLLDNTKFRDVRTARSR
jgi:hypothetical protein